MGSNNLNDIEFEEENAIVLYCDPKAEEMLRIGVFEGYLVVIVIILMSILSFIGWWPKSIESPYNYILGVGGIVGSILLLHHLHCKVSEISSTYENIEKKLVIDDDSIRKFVNHELITEIKYTEIDLVGASWNKDQLESIIGFWIDWNSGKNISVDMMSGWKNPDEIRYGLEKILSFQEKFGFNVNADLQMHLIANKGVWIHK